MSKSLRGEPVRPSLPTLVTQLLHDAVGVARAEIDLAKARVGARLDAAKVGLALLVAAATIALLAAIGLVVGITLALAALVGPALAGVIVAAVGFLVAGLLGVLGSRRLSAPATAIVETAR